MSNSRAQEACVGTVSVACSTRQVPLRAERGREHKSEAANFMSKEQSESTPRQAAKRDHRERQGRELRCHYGLGFHINPARAAFAGPGTTWLSSRTCAWSRRNRCQGFASARNSRIPTRAAGQGESARRRRRPHGKRHFQVFRSVSA